MNSRPRLLLTLTSSAGSRLTNRTKPPTHYETLEVNPRATQSEIKSAYFKLSKEYHPDKNRSESATVKFRDIAEAYEVLGSFESRKIYDRSMLTQTTYRAPQRQDGQADPKIKYYQAQAAVFRDNQKSGHAPIYDFDAWTKAHYGETLHRTIKIKRWSAMRKELRREDNRTDLRSDSPEISLMKVALFLAMLGLALSWANTQYQDRDVPRVKPEGTDGRSMSNTKLEPNRGILESISDE